MKLRLIAVIGLIFLFSQADAGEDIVLKNKKDKTSYTIGMDIGKNLKGMSDVNPDMLTRGINDAFSGSKPLLTEQEMSGIMKEVKQEIMAKQRELAKEAVKNNKKEGEAFLALNKKKKGVVTLPSGLQYKVIKAGTGETPKLTDTVKTNYQGTLINGTEFDSSYKRGQPVTFPVNGVIRGWTEALQLMKAGSKWELFIPSDLAYGERGAGRAIGPHSALVFEIELISIVKEEKP